ncbi:FAD/NAD(P)-binding protein, partial [Klebsiella pneumoniae]|nr:FAD/NAD(P)-binding protein [Klebsiella pneumoniae]
TSFAERRGFGVYLGEQLAGAEHVRLVEEDAVVVRAGEGGWTVRLASGEEVAASALVLAQGNQPPAPMALGAELPAELFVNNPWSAQAGRTV